MKAFVKHHGNSIQSIKNKAAITGTFSEKVARISWNPILKQHFIPFVILEKRCYKWPTHKIPYHQLCTLGWHSMRSLHWSFFKDHPTVPPLDPIQRMMVASFRRKGPTAPHFSCPSAPEAVRLIPFSNLHSSFSPSHSLWTMSF